MVTSRVSSLPPTDKDTYIGQKVHTGKHGVGQTKHLPWVGKFLQGFVHEECLVVFCQSCHGNLRETSRWKFVLFRKFLFVLGWVFELAPKFELEYMMEHRVQMFAKSQLTTLGFNAASDCDLPLLHLCSIFSDGSLWYLVHRSWGQGRLVGHSKTFYIRSFHQSGDSSNKKKVIHIIPNLESSCSPQQLLKSIAHTHVPSLQDVASKVEVHLVAWQHLAHRCTELGLRLYKLRPKHHYFDHLGRDMSRTLLNPRKVHQCNNDESFLGYLKRIGVRCHQANMMHRLFQRYLLFLSIRWHDASCEDKWKQHTGAKCWERSCPQTARAGWELGSTRALKLWCLCVWVRVPWVGTAKKIIPKFFSAPFQLLSGSPRKNAERSYMVSLGRSVASRSKHIYLFIYLSN